MRKWLKTLRCNSNKSQAEIADMLGMTQQYYNLIENGERQKDLDLSIATKLSELLGVSIDWIAEQEQKAKLKRWIIQKIKWGDRMIESVFEIKSEENGEPDKGNLSPEAKRIIILTKLAMMRISHEQEIAARYKKWALIMTILYGLAMAYVVKSLFGF